MNRLALPALHESLVASAATHSFSAGIADLSWDRLRDICDTPHATFAPIHYEPGYAYPLIVWLHGECGNEGHLRQVMPDISTRNYVAIGPRATVAARARRDRFHWRQTCDDVEAAETRVMECIEIAQRRFHVHPKRIFIAGFGCGGTMAIRVAWNHPDRFAGAATIGGPLPTRDCPLRNVKAMRQLPCFLATSRWSRAFPEPVVCSDLRLLHSVGCTVDLRQYPCGDELMTDMLADLNRWMMSQISGSRS
jgi:phospholipase/carboxylesterase